MPFVFSLTSIGVTLMLHSGMTAVIIERSPAGWIKMLSAALLLANGVGVLAVLGRGLL